MTSRTRRVVAAAASTVLLGLAVAACSAGSENDNSAVADDSGGSSLAAPAPAQAEAARGSVAGDVARTGSTSGSGSGSGSGKQDVVSDAGPRSLIREGNVALRSADVSRTLFDIRKILQGTGGEVSDDDTQADEQGDAERALLTVRVPVVRFDTALQQLKGLGTDSSTVKLIDATSTSKDVSSQVVDTDVRVALQKRSIQRISLLLDRATSIRDIVSIERELADREADLGSLEKRQKLLADQTALSTITISVERPTERSATPPEEDESGFAAGLEDGWKAFRHVTTGLLTGAGALLPFALLALVLGVPLRVWLRRRQPRPVVRTPDAVA
ncbi:DUF4349 domain-containing protein [Nocardioides plantarum]|uniref:DUF4349 domain-containing protein n=1 Tax=Nocardioides plantarum TaxID=29299 RepID=A0ABV5K7S7_9ACTN|nr:DUF4349 domain-containing protein [Nocardioides plantarum]